MPLDALVTGRIATFAGDAGFGWVEAVGITDGKVSFAGSAVEAVAYGWGDLPGFLATASSEDRESEP